MYFEQFYLGCLAHASYMLGSRDEAAVIDPQRDVEIYLNAAAERGLKIRHIFETHLHADFVSGHLELARRTGATIYIGARAGAEFPHVPLSDGFELRMGKMRIAALETPGHTPESVSLVITDEEKRPEPWAVLTGDTLFIGDVGRPDLSPNFTSQQLAGMLYDSLTEKLLKLPDDVLVYPAHGAGSLCGRNMRADRFSTIGTERLTNYALQIGKRDEFIQQMTTNLPARPEYFFQDAQINRQGAPALGDLLPLKSISPAELQSLIQQDVFALDVRPMSDFAAGHVPGSINVALSGQFATWAASVLGLNANPVLIADTPAQYAEARTRLARVGIEQVRGFLNGGIEAWKQAGLPLASLNEMTVQQLEQRMDTGNIQVLDVRREPEWQAGHIAGAAWWPLDRFKVSPPEIDPSVPLAVHCAGGYRSVIACSLLRRAGMENVINVLGGFDAWQKAGFEVEKAATVGVS
ncbi:MAG TPA: rhodanese-like domain-containing protein [Candidatus Angelobacter sp.]|jgi:glyoxylase-like metal-dependent hydrolase (beta-lactamase superfamily II)/rhodanese-related sulfurtransferase|nr:rhodanese-like domain-containing protein [Candidatus Angelobacter sp.]